MKTMVNNIYNRIKHYNLSTTITAFVKSQKPKLFWKKN
jgi:hypothetical protein